MIPKYFTLHVRMTHDRTTTFGFLKRKNIRFLNVTHIRNVNDFGNRSIWYTILLFIMRGLRRNACVAHGTTEHTHTV